MKAILTLLLTVSWINGYAQYSFVDPEAMESPCGMYGHQSYQVNAMVNKRFCWADWTVKTEPGKIEQMLLAIKKLNDSLYVDSSGDSVVSRINKHNVHVMDFNNDGNADMISEYTYPIGKKLYQEFWLNTGSSFDHLITLEGEILELTKDPKNNRLVLLLFHEICCSETLYVHKYTISQDEDCKIEMVERDAFIGGIAAPLRNGKLTLNIPVKIDTTFTMYSYKSDYNPFKRPTDAIAKVEAGAEGHIVSEYIGRDGEKWYCVKLKAGTKLVRSRYERDIHIHPKYEGFPINYFGWVKASVVEAR